jgi:hypothetical protein
VAQAGNFGVRGGVAGLDAEVVTAGEDASGGIGEHGADGQAAFTERKAGFGESFFQEIVVVHGNGGQ